MALTLVSRPRPAYVAVDALGSLQNDSRPQEATRSKLPANGVARSRFCSSQGEGAEFVVSPRPLTAPNLVTKASRLPCQTKSDAILPSSSMSSQTSRTQVGIYEPDMAPSWLQIDCQTSHCNLLTNCAANTKAKQKVDDGAAGEYSFETINTDRP